MDKFQVYNRTNNTWVDDSVELVAGWNENFVLDKTTDTATIKVKYNSDTKPNWNNWDWCRIVHGESATYTTKTYTEDNTTITCYIPLNHEQYLIRNITFVKDIINGNYDIQIDLCEPIEMTNGIVCETMSFTNQTSKIVDGTTYTHSALNHYSVIEKILKVTPANNDDYTNQTRSQRKSWFNRFKIADKSLLEAIPFNDETYNEPTLYNILLDKYDSSVGRTPVVYFDINGATDLPFNTAREEYIINFERQDGIDKTIVDYDTLVDGATQIVESQNDENFTDGLVSNYDNLSPNTNIYAPTEKLWLVPEVNSDERVLTSYTTALSADWIVRTPHNIKKVKSVIRILYQPQTYENNNLERLLLAYSFKDFSNVTVGSTTQNAILEEKQYKASEDFYQQTDCVWYKEGDNKIHINEAYYTNIQIGSALAGYHINCHLFAYQVEYEPLVSGRFDLGADYQTQVNQVDNQVDSKKFGEYLENYFASMNKSDITITKTIDTWNDIAEIGTRVDNGNKHYIITNVSVENRGYVYNVTYQLNENHIRKNDSIQAPQEIRKNIEIEIDSTKERKSMLARQLKLSLSSTGLSSEFDKESVFSSLKLNNVTASKNIQIGYLTINSNYPLISSSTGATNVNLLCEVAKYILNNTMCFNFRFMDNAEAGKNKDMQTTSKLVYDTPAYTTVGATVEFNSSPSNQYFVLYTDIFGEFDTFNISLCNLNTLDLKTATTPETFEEKVDFIEKVNKSIALMGKYPLIENNVIQSSDKVATINNINYKKDMLDTFNYTIGLNIECDDNIIISENLLKNSILMNSEPKQLKYIQFFDTNMDLNDYPLKKTTATFNQITTSTFDSTNSKFTLGFSSQTVKKCIVLSDEDENPLLIINDFDKTTSETTINNLELYC